MKRIVVCSLALAIVAAGAVAAAPQNGAKGAAKVITKPSGLKYQELEAGQGDEAKSGMLVMVNYNAWLEDGTKFDSSYDRREPFSFKLGANQVIQGWEEGVLGMKVGGKRKLIIPPSLGYGEQGAGDRVPPNATLVFEVELLKVYQP